MRAAQSELILKLVGCVALGIVYGVPWAWTVDGHQQTKTQDPEENPGGDEE